MFENLSDYFLAFVPMFVAVDALGMVPIYLSLTEGMSREEKNSLVRHSTWLALLVSVIFLCIGKLVFFWLGITISDFLVAGGAILFIVSIRDILSLHKGVRLAGESIGVVPLAIPLIVGPAVLTTSLILLDSMGIGPTLFALVVNILICGAVLMNSHLLDRFLGRVGSSALSKIASLLLAAIGVMLMRRGLLQMFANLS